MSEIAGNYDFLLEAYRLLWNNRVLATTDLNSEGTLKEAIKRELLDENSHPRARKNKYEKYYSAITRIVDSKISTEEKVLLIKTHNQVMEEITLI